MSATGRRFSRSPLTSDVRTGVSRTTRSLVCLPTSSARRDRAGARGFPFGGVRGAGSRALKDDAHDLALELGTARHDRDRAAADRELTGLVRARALRVADVVQAIDELPFRERLAAPQFQGPCEHARQDAVALAVEPAVDEVREADVVVRARGNQRDAGTAATAAAIRTQRIFHHDAIRTLSGLSSCRPRWRVAIEFPACSRGGLVARSAAGASPTRANRRGTDRDRAMAVGRRVAHPGRPRPRSARRASGIGGGCSRRRHQIVTIQW